MESVLCHKCGTPIPPVENYCSNCGTRKKPIDDGIKQKSTKWDKYDNYLGKAQILIGIGGVLWGIVSSNLVYVLLGFAGAVVGFILATSESKTLRRSAYIISAIILVVLTVWLIPKNIQEQNEIQERLDVAIMDLDSIVDRAIRYCSDVPTSECDELMLQWFEECKKENMELIPSCNDGRIAEYLLRAGLIEGN